VIEHLDENGKPCTKHATMSPHGLLALAVLGSRMPSFHHDVASKLQGLMMAVDEISELADTMELQQAASAASVAIRELTELFAANRSLGKAPQRKPTPIAEVIARAAERAGVGTRGELPARDVDIALPSIGHALAVLLDLAAGPLKLGRMIEIHATIEAAHLMLIFVGPPTAMDTMPANANDMLALASFAIYREGGELRCGTDRFTVRLPLTA
jgi:hypothetical protein